MINLIELRSDLARAVNYYQDRLKRLRTGRAKVDMFTGLIVNAYEMDNLLQAVANVIIESPTSVVIAPWDKGIIDNVMKTLLDANMGYSPIKDTDKIRINIPQLTEETRKEIVKEMYLIQEEVKVTVRQIRHRFMEAVEKAEGVSEDEQKRDKVQIQKLVDETNSKLEELSAAKELDIMTI